MMRELANPSTKTWFQRAYEQYAVSNRAADTMPGISHYKLFSLTDRFAETDVRNLANQRTVPYGPGNLLTAKMRQQGLMAHPRLFIPATTPKAAAQSDAQTQLGNSPSCIPPTQDQLVPSYDN